MKKEQIINKYIEERGYKSYLEIGSEYGKSFNSINCLEKFAVDPAPRFKGERLFTMESDEFFANYPLGNKKFDVIFIDGLHTSEQVEKDIWNSLKRLKKGGMIFVHDVWPPSEWHARTIEHYKWPEEWCGDVWKAFWQTGMHDFKVGVYEDDYGVGVIDGSKESDEVIDVPEDYKQLIATNKKYKLE